MKIALILTGALETISGGFLYDRQLISRLREEGDTVDIICLPRRTYGAQLMQNLRFRLPGGYSLVLQDELAHASLLFANSQQREAPIVSIVHNLRSAATDLQWRGTMYRAVERKYLATVDAFIFNSGTTRDSVESLMGSSKPHVVAPPGGDRLGELTEDFVKTRAAEPGPLRLLFLANVIRGKGLHILLDALARLSPRDVALQVVGSCDIEPDYADAMRRVARNLALAATFHGPLNDQRLGDQLREAQVLALPSFYEGFGIAFLEGMSHGLPAIGTTAGAMPELIADGINGYLIPPGDSEALARRLVQIGADRALLARLGVGALRSYRARPTWGQSARQIRRFLNQTLEQWESSRN